MLGFPENGMGQNWPNHWPKEKHENERTTS